MKLLCLHIENFGTLHDIDERFFDGLNVRLHPNGYGKSTLAVFIKSMLYGLPASTRRSLIENERRRYTPWQGGVFGGSLDIEVGGEEFRIERTFGAKEADDTLSVLSLRTGETVKKDWADAPGEKLLGVGIAAYERSTYLSQRPDELTRDGMDSIHQKLNRLADEADDLGRFDAAMTALDRRRQYYSLMGRRGGAIADTERAIAELESRLAACREAARALTLSREREQEAKDAIARCRQALEALDRRERALYGAREARAVGERLEALHREECTLREQIETMRRSLGGVVPTKQTVESLETAIRKRDELRARLASQAMSESETAELSRLRSHHGNTPPSPEALDEIRTLADRFHRATVDAVAADELYHARFLPVLEDAPAALRKSIERLEQEVEEQLAEREALSAADRRRDRIDPVLYTLLVLSIAAIFGGVWLPILFLVGGGMTALLSATLAIRRIRRRSRDIEYARHVSSIDYHVAQRRKRIEGERITLRALEHGTELAARWRKITMYYDAPKNGQDAPSAARRLTEDITRLRELSAREASILKAREEIEKELTAAEAAVRALLSPMTDAPEDDRRALLWLTELRGRLVDCSERYLQKQDEIRALRERHGIDEDAAPTASTASEDESEDAIRRERARLQDELDAWSQALTRETQDGEQLANRAEGESETEAERERLCAVLSDQKAALDAITNAQTYLKQARDSLSGRYLATVKERFGYYLSCLTGKASPELTMDGQFHVKLRAGGIGRTADEFSVGQRDLIALCERMALLDAMFEGERPFLVLDDPFANWDNDTVARGLALLQTVSERYQLLYLTCHTGRMPSEA
ncbi:MAG: AAA family ATPase [Clostridia bacterium]|nr:AAA family ATPase [Clostridia bacterium]